MTTEADVRSSKSPQAAMLAIARGIDRVEAKLATAGGQDADWSTAWEDHLAASYPEAAQHVFGVIENGDNTEVVLPPPDAARYAGRLIFAEQSLHLDEYYMNAEGAVTAPEGYASWNEVYAKGGPYWLYTQDRDCVMSLPYGTRQTLVSDLEQDDPKVAHEVARDILKQDADSSRAQAPS